MRILVTSSKNRGISWKINLKNWNKVTPSDSTNHGRYFSQKDNPGTIFGFTLHVWF
jgi:hypothetical protein